MEKFPLHKQTTDFWIKQLNITNILKISNNNIVSQNNNMSSWILHLSVRDRKQIHQQKLCGEDDHKEQGRTGERGKRGEMERDYRCILFYCARLIVFYRC